MPDMIRARAAHEPHSTLQSFECDPGALGDEDVEIAVEPRGIRHSGLSIAHLRAGRARYRIVLDAGA